MGKTKREMVKTSFKDYVKERELKLYSFNRNAFEDAWLKIPMPLQKKLNAKDLWDYMRLHVIPSLTNPLLPFKDAYQEGTQLKKHTKEFYA